LDLATDLASEITEIGLKPDARLFDSLILASLSQRIDRSLRNTSLGVESAYQYYKDMIRLGFRPTQKIITLLYARLKEGDDPRATDVLQDVTRLFPLAGAQPKQEDIVKDEGDEDFGSSPDERSDEMREYLEAAKAAEILEDSQKEST
jgi:hypothetical protein